MSNWDLVLPPAPAYCDGCARPLLPGVPVHGERLTTPLGYCYRRTHDRPECIASSRRAVKGKPVKVRETTQDKVNARARGQR